MKTILIKSLAIVFAGFLICSVPCYAEFENTDCLDCHEETMGEQAVSYDSSLESSVHNDLTCVDCHGWITDLPHDEIEPVAADCGECHSDAAEIYQWHGRLNTATGEDIPSCADCHGRHDILPSTDRGSMVNPVNLYKTCGFCHEDLDLTKKHEILYGHAVEVYQNSVHGKAALGGIYSAATCNDCHSSGGTSHRILAPNHVESTINHFNIPKTCGKCHHNIEQDYWEGIHGQLVLRGEVDVPVCTHCHGEHGIISPSDPRSPVSSSRLAEATCAPCHESANLNEKYGIPSGRLESYVDSYHGLKSKAGDLEVANCASCHGAHRILSHLEPTSSIHPENLQATCGNCHPGISSEMAQAKIHGTPGVSQTPMANLVRTLYIILIVVVIGGMILHWIIDLRKQIKALSKGEQIRRMTYNELWQHNFLMVSFILLVISGFALRFSDSGWVQWLFGWEGGFPFRGILHRVAGVVLMFTAVWHMLYLTTARGRQFLRDMIATWEDVRQIFQLIGYNLGVSKEKPRFGRFSYIEKAEYWALVWGTAIMAVTGLLLWFDNLVVVWVPKGVLDVMLVIHYYEAWLATLAILVWHMYSTVFSPGVYPMNPSWLTGKMPRDMFKHEHPGENIEEQETE